MLFLWFLYRDSQGERFREGCERRIVHTSQLMTVLLDVDNGPWAAADPYHSHPHEQTTFVSEGEVLGIPGGGRCAAASASRRSGGDSLWPASRYPASFGASAAGR